MKISKFILLILSSCFLITCESLILGKVHLTKDKSKGKITSQSNAYKNQEFYVIEKDQLPDLRKANSLTYLGSDSIYHYLKVWNKAGYPEEISLVAIDKNAIKVEDEATIDYEVNYKPENYDYHPWRHVNFKEGNYVVSSWREILTNNSDTNTNQ